MKGFNFTQASQFYFMSLIMYGRNEFFIGKIWKMLLRLAQCIRSPNRLISEFLFDKKIKAFCSTVPLIENNPFPGFHKAGYSPRTLQITFYTHSKIIFFIRKSKYNIF